MNDPAVSAQAALLALQAMARQTVQAPGPEAERLYRKFSQSRQEPVRLAAALRGFFLDEPVPEEQRAEYAAYLRRRIRPAVEALLEAEDVGRLERLEALGFLADVPLDGFLELACRRRQYAGLLWLLHLLNRRDGPRDRDLTL